MKREIGAVFLKADSWKFTVWAPDAETVDVVLKDKKKRIELQKFSRGYWENTVSGVGPGDLYKFSVNGKELPDPASRSQPEGVHSWSRIIDPIYKWDEKAWKGMPISEMIIYELHVGTFTTDGTFAAVMDKLPHLRELGVNTLEIMPIAQFPGSRNWGYDGVYPYAVQESYGGPKMLKEFINTCHREGFAVILDVVYNHMGPEGNYLSEYGPYFTEKYKTPWGSAINYDDKQADEVRNFFLQNALMWLRDFRFDGLRLDAIHEIIDRGANHFLKELSQNVDELERETGRNYVLIAESDLNDTRIINSYEKGGYGLEAQWVDDFHHSLHTLVTGEKEGYYSDFGDISQLEKSIGQAFVYDAAYSNFRKRTIGNSPKGIAPSKFVVCIQNHDQVGNRMLGDRLSKLVSFEKLKLSAGILLMSPFVPMLFMGEEFAEDNPFQYFVSHGDPDLVKAVQEGRKREFEYFFKENGGKFPDPQSEETFQNSKLNWDFKENEIKKTTFKYYKELIRLRKKGVFRSFRGERFLVKADEKTDLIELSAEERDKKILVFLNFGPEARKINVPKENDWNLLLASADKKWGGPKEFPEKIFGNRIIELPEDSLIILES